MIHRNSRTALSALAGAFVLFAGPAWAAQDSPPPRSLTVSGQGEIRAVPDEAVLSAGVVTEGRSAADALARNSRAMNSVFDMLKHLGIPDKSIQTSDFSVTPQYASDAHGNTTQKINGYEVSNNVTVVVDDLGRLGGAIDALVSSGANSFGGIQFTIKDPKPLLDQARALAVKDALDRAGVYAKAAGVSLGPIDSIGESGDEVPRPMFRAMSMAAGMPRPSPVAAGEQKIAASVSITFEIR
jgi:uncharacterized protein